MAKKMIATIGSFDGVHRGHQALLKELITIAHQENMDPMVITFDRLPSSVINPQKLPLQLTTSIEKVEMIQSLGINRVEVIPFNINVAQRTAKDFFIDTLSKYDVAMLLMGHDHKFGSDRLADLAAYQEIGASLGIRVVRSNLEIVEDVRISSSNIRNLISNGEIVKANTLLGYPYKLLGTVVGGMKIGRTMGYPTANIDPIEDRKLLPAHGVYAVYIHIDGVRYKAMLYIGRRPTMDDGRSITIEVNVFDVNENLYAKQVEIEFIQYTRSDCKFKNIDQLKARIKQDECEIRAILT